MTMTEWVDVYLAAWQDPLFLWFPVVTQLVSMGVFLLAAMPLG